MPLLPSVRELEEAIRLRRQIDALEKRLSSILRGATPRPSVTTRRRYFSPSTRVKLSAAAKARWAWLSKRPKKKPSDLPTRNPGSKYRP